MSYEGEGLFYKLLRWRGLGVHITDMHTYRFGEERILPSAVLKGETAKPGQLAIEDIIPAVSFVRSVCKTDAILTGGWAVRLLCNGNVSRQSSPDLDFLVDSITLTRKSTAMDLRPISEWGSRAGFFETAKGMVRLEMNPVDVLPEYVDIKANDLEVRVVSPLFVTIGKLIRTYKKGAKERDLIDISALLASKYGEQLDRDLRTQSQIDRRVKESLSRLDLLQ